MMIMMKAANLGLRFLLELCILASLCYWGFHIGNGWLLKGILGIGAPLLAAILWGMFVSPKASITVSQPLQFIIELVIFAAAIIALYVTGKHSLAICFALFYILHRILKFLWEQ
ncbi:YrdB family protein [Paenibacillus alginolyticus]|uniref:YrdB family protein n=1 Tax=Paenibacillus alginolyticus TaxID=59839 RepID=UPI00041E206D|nr:YrdB family protein [Paenibacillus alginolyticus]MCY9667060.1 YrdB family protein [Paenibacillus alginolyticus]